MDTEQQILELWYELFRTQLALSKYHEKTDHKELDAKAFRLLKDKFPNLNLALMKK